MADKDLAKIVDDLKKTPTLQIKLGEGARMPVRKNEGDAGADLYSTENVIIAPMGRAVVGTGLYFEIPSGYEVQIRSRSGLAAKNGVFVLNSPGTIDEGYRNEVKVILQNLGKEPFTVNKGDRIAQMVISSLSPHILVAEVDKLSNVETERGLGGFGSTGV